MVAAVALVPAVEQRISAENPAHSTRQLLAPTTLFAQTLIASLSLVAAAEADGLKEPRQQPTEAMVVKLD
jgi:hypothetical protein